VIGRQSPLANRRSAFCITQRCPLLVFNDRA
jgi:hypothetical protein